MITSASGAGMQSDTTRAAILIVDGDELDRDLLRAGLRLAGFHNLHTAGTGQAALTHIAADMPDLILLDALLPDLSGEEVTRRIRAAYPGEFIPIIMVSVMPETEDRIRGIEAGANDYIAKPTSLEELVARMNSLLSLKQARDELQRERARAEALINQTGDPVLVVDMAGTITRVNPAAERTLGLDVNAVGRSPGDVFGLPMSDLIHRAQERGSAVSGEHTVQRDPPEEPRTYNVSVSPIQEVGYLLVWQDITPIKVAEQVRLASERAERERVQEALSRYMSPSLVERVLSDRDILIRRERREALVMFADLRGFTRLTVEHSANDVVTLLNDVFSKMMDIVYEHEGVVFDIAGDELMIAFNVPYSQPDARQRALATAIAMQRRFGAIRRRWAERQMRVGMGIGINAGMVVLGHVGGRARMNYAMVGEAVNVAHQLVDVARDGQIVVSPDVLAGDLPDVDGIRMEELPPRQVKGTDTPLRMILVTVDD